MGRTFKALPKHAVDNAAPPPLPLPPLSSITKPVASPKHNGTQARKISKELAERTAAECTAVFPTDPIAIGAALQYNSIAQSLRNALPSSDDNVHTMNNIKQSSKAAETKSTRIQLLIGTPCRKQTACPLLIALRVSGRRLGVMHVLTGRAPQ